MPDPIITHLMLLANIDELAQILRKEKIEGPVESYTNLLLQSGQLTEIRSFATSTRREILRR